MLDEKMMDSGINYYVNGYHHGNDNHNHNNNDSDDDNHNDDDNDNDNHNDNDNDNDTGRDDGWRRLHGGHDDDAARYHAGREFDGKYAGRDDNRRRRAGPAGNGGRNNDNDKDIDNDNDNANANANDNDKTTTTLFILDRTMMADSSTDKTMTDFSVWLGGMLGKVMNAGDFMLDEIMMEPARRMGNGQNGLGQDEMTLTRWSGMSPC